MKRVLPALFLLLAFRVDATLASDLDGGQIRQMLSGNSIVSPTFGCLFYDPRGKTTTVDLSGDMTSGTWAVNGKLYISSGRCGLAGCTISGTYPDIIYRSLDGQYVLPVTVIKGNFCQKNVVVS